MLSTMLALGSMAWALPPAPAPLTISAEETAALSAGEVVFRDGAAGTRVAVLDVEAPPAAVMSAVMDLSPRVADIGALLSMDEYLDAPGRKGARWELGASVYSATFHVLYEYDAAQGWCVYTLDASKENDIKSTDGSYQVYAVDGGSRLVYRSQQTSSILPSWLMQKFAHDGAVELLTGIRARAGG